MAEPTITIERLGKMYRLEHEGSRPDSFRDAVAGAVTAPFRRLMGRGGTAPAAESFWALRDVSFEVARGEVVGIVGRNGAGKSTLLKILSRIVEPTEGRAVLRGRVASLLEVGTGFHPDLTGRENVYLNGSILGMKRAEIDRKFDDIVAFAEIERFLDTPVKRYSSGMYVRLAFAVAAHLEPEILVVDEVLAVGDAEFQKKCLGKMEEVSRGGGRTVLFVSHNMSAVRSLCRTAVLLDRGTVRARGDVGSVLDQYAADAAISTPAGSTGFERPRGAHAWMTSAALVADGEVSSVVPMGASISLRVEFEAEDAVKHPRFGLVLSTPDGVKLLAANNRYQPSPAFEEGTRRGAIVCDLGEVPLMPGRYYLSLYLGDQVTDFDVRLEALTFEVSERDIWGLGKLPPSGVQRMWWPTEFRLEGGATVPAEAARKSV